MKFQINIHAENMLYYPAPYIKWSVESDGIKVINQQTGLVYTIYYPQAALWDLMAREYKFKLVFRMICKITAAEPAAAHQLIMESIEKWVQKGLLIKKGGHD